MPAIQLIGCWDIKEVIPTDQLNDLAAWANAYERNQDSGYGRTFRIRDYQAKKRTRHEIYYHSSTAGDYTSIYS